jgi:hypothetical protein
MPDEQPRVGRFDPHNDARACGTEGHRPILTCPACGTGGLRPFRVVKRYRGDEIVPRFAAADWCDVWQLQAGDVSWPNSRRG